MPPNTTANQIASVILEISGRATNTRILKCSYSLNFSMANNPALQCLMVATLQGFPFRWQ